MRSTPAIAPRLLLALVALPGWFATSAAAATLRGLVSVGSSAEDSRSDDFTASLDKSAFDLDVPAARIVLHAEATLPGDIVVTLVTDADSRRSSVLDVQEAWFGWNPVPTSAWRMRAKLGAFFPVDSLEVGYDQPGWNAAHTNSSAAVNSWIAQEIRVIGAEFTGQWRGALLGSPHAYTVRLGVFAGNDPAGTEIAWRGWDLSGRVTGLFQKLRLPDLPVYRPAGPIPQQTRDVHVFRELDHRPGWYGALGYGFEGVLEIEAMHYDNRADPLELKHGQYGWRTKFDHLGARLTLPGEWELLSQGMRGSALMGPNAVYLGFSSWYLLAGKELGPGRATLRYDWFHASEHDILPGDPNSESGHAWALAYSLPLPHSLVLVAEALRVDSRRAARSQIGENPRRRENSLALELRWVL
jgi:hypothetical protein